MQKTITAQSNVHAQDSLITIGPSDTFWYNQEVSCEVQPSPVC